ncbi:MAG: T9SS type A sorting domain-containing protein, partial [Bacteroidota bacterium]
VRAEQIIDSVAYALGYRIAYEDHDGHVEDEPAGINNARPSYFVYEAKYPNGVRIVKIDMNGSLNDGCPGSTPRCETSAEAIRRFDNTVAARLADPDTGRVYYFAVVVHANGHFAGKHAEVSGVPPRPDEYSALNTLLDTLQQRVQSGIEIKFVTPAELASIFYAQRGITSVEDERVSLPREFRLHQNYPNPFNPSTTIRFSIPRRGKVALKVLDVLGREVATLVNESLTPGSYSVRWNASGFSGGIFFYALTSRNASQTRKLILLR